MFGHLKTESMEQYDVQEHMLVTQRERKEWFSFSETIWSFVISAQLVCLLLDIYANVCGGFYTTKWNVENFFQTLHIQFVVITTRLLFSLSSTNHADYFGVKHRRLILFLISRLNLHVLFYTLNLMNTNLTSWLKQNMILSCL